MQQCPKGVAPLEQILKLRKMAVDAGFTNNAGTRHADAFAESVKHSGRLNELTLLPKSTGLFNIVGQLKTLPSAFNMARAGKLPPLIHKAIPGVKRIQGDFRTCRRTVQVKVAFYPGCVSKGACPELYVSAKLIAEPLGLELHELTSAPCTGAGVLSEQNPDLGGRAQRLDARDGRGRGRRSHDDLQHVSRRALESSTTTSKRDAERLR